MNITSDALYSDNQQNDNGDFIISEGAVLTIDQSTADLRRFICSTFGTGIIKNESTTTPIVVAIGSTGSQSFFRFEGAGKSRIEGEFIELGTGNGTAEQVFNVPLAMGVNGVGTQSCPNLGGLWITGGSESLRDGTSVPRLALEVDDTAYGAATDQEYLGNVFKQDTSANTVTFKRAVPVGHKVVMGNIIVKTGDTLASTDVDFDFSTGGEVTWDKCHFSGKFNTSFQGAKKVFLTHSVVKTIRTVTINFAAQIEAPELVSCIFKTPVTGSSLSLNNSALAGNVKNVWIDSAPSGGSNQVVAANTSTPYFEKLIITNYLATTFQTGGRAAVNTSAGNLTLLDSHIGSYLHVVNLQAGSSNCRVDNIKFQIGCRTDLTGISEGRVLNIQNSSNNRVTNIEQIQLTGVGSNQACLQVGAGSSNNVIANVTITSKSDAQWDNILSDAGFETRLNNVLVKGQTKDRAVVFNSTSLACEVSNIYFEDQQTGHNQTQQVGARAKINQLQLNSTSGVFASSAIGTSVDTLSILGIANTQDGAPVNKTEGKMDIRMSPTSLETDYYTEIVQTGVIVFSNTNRLYIENADDQVVLESFVHNNLTAVTSATKLGSTVSQFDVEIAVRRPGGAYTDYVAYSSTSVSTAISSLDSDSLNRVQFRARITKVSTGLTQYLTTLRMDCTLSGDDYPFILERLQATASGLVAGSRIQLYNVTTATEVTNEVMTGTSFAIDYENGSDYSTGDVVRLRVTYQNGTTAYLPFESTAIANNSGISFLVTQVLDTIYNSNNIDGSTVSTLTSDFPNVQVDINDADGDADVREIYARYVYVIATEQGIDWFGGVTAINNVNYRVNTSILDLTIQNIGSVAVNLSTARIFRDDGAIILAAEDGDKPITQDNGEFVQFIQPQINGAMNTNAKLDGVSKNTNLIPALL